MRFSLPYGLHDLVYSYFLREHDKKRGRYQISLRHDQEHIVTCLRSVIRNGRISISSLSAIGYLSLAISERSPHTGSQRVSVIFTCFTILLTESHLLGLM